MSNLHDRGTLRGTLQRNSGNYNDLINKPAINGHTLIGNQSGHALGLANKDDIIYVEANPLGPATADLRKILVDDTIYSIPDVVVYGTASGAIASFDDGGDNKPLKSLKVAINPVQSGSGDPSPSNVRPISGWTGANVAVCGKNLFNKTNNIEMYLDGSARLLTNVSFKSVVIPLKNGATYTFNQTLVGNYKRYALVNSLTDGTTIYQPTDTLRTGYIETTNFTFTNSSNIKYLIATIYRNTDTYTFDDLANTCQLEVGTTATTYTAYNGTTYPITWSEAGEVFGGTLDVTNGKLKARPYYASYNGETLIGPWISSMDVYAPNTPPTTGAQVVDLGGVETEIDISPTQITTLLGNNNLWSDTGDILECVYQRDLNIAINKALSQ